ncbi:hypothetical protein AJ80_06188 [Polytolypa hystricis UAMH7299]|uniref:Uncharacterized protein n=1 Tax=Polytolypa hystricis (strain UAMH7299) TaxID=1447883 RepID=A0A2B7XXP5_POLH7|nr:hypothetical protein AJ80_06188 [Polytolypa hystricis UAMH7299]
MADERLAVGWRLAPGTQSVTRVTSGIRGLRGFFDQAARVLLSREAGNSGLRQSYSLSLSDAAALRAPTQSLNFEALTSNVKPTNAASIRSASRPTSRSKVSVADDTPGLVRSQLANQTFNGRLGSADV